MKEAFILDEVDKEAYVGAKYIPEPVEKTSSLNPDYVNQLINCGRSFSKWGWAPAYNETGSSGNLGFRDGADIAVTATNKSLGSLIFDDIIKVKAVDKGTNPPTVIYEKSGDRKPTSEVLAYWEIFGKREDVKFILHGHDGLTTKMAGVIAKYYPDLAARTDRNLPYGTIDFANALGEKLTDYNKYLIARGHGFFALGSSFGEALLYARIIHDLTNFILRPYVRVRGSNLIADHLPKKLEGLIGTMVDTAVCPVIGGTGRLGGRVFDSFNRLKHTIGL